jgi:hypothetical protein
MISNISCSNCSLLKYLPTVQGVWGSSPGPDICAQVALDKIFYIIRTVRYTSINYKKERRQRHRGTLWHKILHSGPDASKAKQNIWCSLPAQCQYIPARRPHAVQFCHPHPGNQNKCSLQPRFTKYDAQVNYPIISVHETNVVEPEPKPKPEP